MSLRWTATQQQADRDPVRWRLFAIGFVSLFVYGLIALLSTRFRYGEGHHDRPILEVLGLLGLAWVGYALALAWVLGRRGNRPADPKRLQVSARRLPVVLGFALAFRVLLIFSNPIQEIDYYRYLWDGRVVLNGLNPFHLEPAEMDRLGPFAAADTPQGRLWQLSRTSESVQTIFERIHHREVPTIYPPTSQAVFAVSALLTPASAPLAIHVFVLKCLLLVFDVGTLLVMIQLLRRIGLPGDWCLAYGWCPLVLKEVANTAHLDTIAVFFTVLAAYWLVGTSEHTNGWRSLRTPVLGAFAIGLAVLAQGYPLIL